MKKIFAIIICLAIFIPSFSFGITQDQYLLLVAKSLFNQVEKLKQEQFYANIFKFMNKPKPQAIQKVIDNEEPVNAQKRNGAFTFDCVKQDIADEIIDKIAEKYPDKVDSIDTENHKTIL
ncbi:MAG: hypothetical protein PHO23_01085 [Candidatus Pacebacteria bacterium]|nr:hypothetical protein [Candidatus Paceibacterota bacterium]